MSNLIYPHTATISRASVVNDPTDGARMVPSIILVGLPCSIQPGRDKPTRTSNSPHGLEEPVTDALPEWTLYCITTPIPIRKNDTVLDNLNRLFRIDETYITPLGTKCVMSSMYL